MLKILMIIAMIILPRMVLSAMEDDSADAFDRLSTSDSNVEDALQNNGSITPENPLNLSGNNYQLTSSPKATIIALNKITAKSSTLMLDKNESAFFGNIEIRMHECWQNKDPLNLENQLLLTVTDNKIDEDAQMIFNGWLFSSSPSISTLEHPVYDIFVKSCINNKS